MNNHSEMAEIVRETRGMLWIVLKILRTVLIIVSVAAAVAAGAFALHKFLERRKSECCCFDDDEFDFEDEILPDNG